MEEPPPDPPERRFFRVWTLYKCGATWYHGCMDGTRTVELGVVGRPTPDQLGTLYRLWLTGTEERTAGTVLSFAVPTGCRTVRAQALCCARVQRVGLWIGSCTATS